MNKIFNLKKVQPLCALLSKIPLIMRISLVLLFVFAMHISAEQSYSQSTRITLDMKSSTVEKVLQTIEAKSEFYFLYSNRLIDVDRTVNVDVENEAISSILDRLFSTHDVEYAVKGKQIILSPKAKAEIATAVEEKQQQQGKTVTGNIVDQNGEPIIGANIMEVGTSNGTITDYDGNFTLNVEDDAVLRISYIGYLKKEIDTQGENSFDIVLQEDTKALDEVVVVGYGTMKKSDLTGSVASITSDEFENYAITNAETALVGKLPGVYASTSSGQPGSGASIRIRGVGTVNNNNPLYVVDGLFMDDMSDINPNDIERIEVLKDASSTAIYGSRGSNGVVVVTTKKGSTGDFVVSLNGYVGATNSIYTPEMSNSEQLYDFLRDSYSNDDLGFPTGIKELYERGVSTDWWDVSTRSGLTQNYSLSIRGGTERLKSSLSLGFVGEDGFIKNTFYNRLNLRSYLEYELSEKLSVGTNLNIVKSKNREMRGFYEPVWQITSADPFSYVYNPSVDKNDPEYRYNKYAPTEYSYTNNPLFLLESNNGYTKRFNTYGSIFADFDFLENLNYRVQFSFNKPTSNSNNFDPKYSLEPSDLNIAQLKYRNYNRVTTSMRSIWNTTWQHILSFNKKIGENHNLDAMLGLTYESNLYEDISGVKNNTPGNGEEYWVLDAATDILSLNGSRQENSILSYLGRINYAYADRYLATISFRADGSSRFSESNRWGYFPSFSIGWRLNNEEFFKDLEFSEISNLKLRLGWGQTGNQNIANNAAITTVGTSSSDIYVFGDAPYQAYGPVNMGNSNIRWEVSEQSNLGIDLGLFDNKLQVTADYFIKKTKDMLLQLSVPALTGFPNAPWQNAGSIKNSGFELSTNYQNIKKNFSYNIGMNLSFYKNKVTSLGTGDEPIYYSGIKTSTTKTEVGKAVALFYGYKQEGIFQTQQEIEKYTNEAGELIQPLAKPGDFKFKDINNDGRLNEDDRTYIGDPHPDLIYGINFSCRYKNVDFSTALSGTLGNDMWNEYLFKGFATSTDNVPLDAYENAWRQENDRAKYPRISQSDLNHNSRPSSWYVEDGSYMRVKNIQLGYNFPESFIKKTKLFSSFRVYVSGQNLFTLTSYGGMDPEVGTDNIMALGIESLRYPSSKIISVGVNITF